MLLLIGLVRIDARNAPLPQLQVAGTPDRIERRDALALARQDDDEELTALYNYLRSLGALQR